MDMILVTVDKINGNAIICSILHYVFHYLTSVRSSDKGIVPFRSPYAMDQIIYM